MDTKINAETTPLNAASPRDAASVHGLADYWREWVIENPFLVHDLRRWWKKGRLLRMWLVCSGLPFLVLLLVHGLRQWFSPEARGWFGRPFGLILLCGVSAVHVIAAAATTASVFSLAEEARADRLGFIRLLPMGRRELLGKIGAARAAFRVLALLSALPVYLLALAYGGASTEDVAGLYLLYAAFLFAPPGVAELTTALSARHGEDAAVNPQGKKGLGPGFFIWIAVQAVIQGLGRFLIQPIIAILRPQLRAVFGTELGGLLPTSVVVATARFLATPQPFFRWTVIPFLIFAAYWVARTAYRLIMVAEFWAREPLQRLQSGGQKLVLLPEAIWLKEELAQKRRWGNALGIVVALLWAGFLWKSAFLSGAMGALVGVPTPDGGMAALAALVIGGAAWASLEVIRIGTTPLPEGPWTHGLRALGNATARTVAAIALAAALGGVAPWPETPVRLLAAALIGLAALLFAVGWRSVFAPREETAQEPPARMRLIFAALLSIASYVGPFALIAFPNGSQALHAAVSWSPVYGLLRLFPGLWKQAPTLPLWLCVLSPAAVGGLLLLLGSRRTGAVTAPKEKPRHDPLEQRLRQWVEAQGSPYLSLAMHRILRRPGGPLQALLTSFVTLLLVSGAFIGFIGYAASAQGSVLQVLSRHVPAVEMRLGGVVGLCVSAFILYVSLYPLDLVLMATVQTEERASRKQGRRAFLLISGITDRQIVTGLLGSALLTQFPTFAAAWLTSLCWLLVAFFFGAPLWWAVVWALGLAVGVGLALQGGLFTFRDWIQEPRWLRGVRQLFQAVRGTLLMTGLMIAMMINILHSGNPLELLFTLMWTLPLLLSPILLLLPRLFKGALTHVHRSRMEENLERA